MHGEAERCRANGRRAKRVSRVGGVSEQSERPNGPLKMRLSVTRNAPYEPGEVCSADFKADKM